MINETRIRFNRSFNESIEDTLKVLEENWEQREKEILKDALEGTDILTLERLKILTEDIEQPFGIRYLAAICYNLVCDRYRREEQESERR